MYSYPYTLPQEEKDLYVSSGSESEEEQGVPKPALRALQEVSTSVEKDLALERRLTAKKHPQTQGKPKVLKKCTPKNTRRIDEDELTNAPLKKRSKLMLQERGGAKKVLVSKNI